MQLGELQSQMERFEARGVKVVALSVDPPSHSRAMISRMKLTFPLVSDEDQAVMQAYGVQNPDTRELALHAVYLVDETRRIFYRKVAGRRPKSQELLDAVDYHRGQYPLADESRVYEGTIVAFPRNNFQALIEIATNGDLPEGVEPDQLLPVIELIKAGKSDDATIAYRKLAAEFAVRLDEAALLAVAAWLSKTVIELPPEAVLTGRGLSEALTRQRLIRADSEPSTEQLSAVEKDLDTLRSLVRSQQDSWRLRRAKTTLRGYRELSMAALR